MGQTDSFNGYEYVEYEIKTVYISLTAAQFLTLTVSILAMFASR